VSADGGVPALYDVTVTHTRQGRVRNTFRYHSVMWLVDPLDPPKLPGPLKGLARFDPRDHLDIAGLLAAEGVAADHMVMLANPRSLGYCFNPISFYWCYGPDGTPVARVAEVHNTYGGRHAYLLRDNHEGASEVEKQMYVSPFYPVDGTYTIRASEPAETVRLSVSLRRGTQPGPTFAAGLVGRRRPLTAFNLLRSWLVDPWAPARVRALIQWQGLKLWARGLEVRPR